MHMTAEKGRVDVLDESFEPKVGFLSHRNGQLQASDTLLMIATRHGQHEAAWRLLGRDASLKIRDLQEKTAEMIAAEGIDEKTIAVFEKRD